jgi:hypothetical protein
MACAELVWPAILADSVDVKLHLAALGAEIDVKGFLVNEQFAEIAEDTPTGAFVEVLGPGKREHDFAGRTVNLF